MCIKETVSYCIELNIDRISLMRKVSQPRNCKARLFAEVHIKNIERITSSVCVYQYGYLNTKPFQKIFSLVFLPQKNVDSLIRT